MVSYAHTMEQMGIYLHFWYFLKHQETVGNRLKQRGPGRTRTCNQRIMSPLL